MQIWEYRVLVHTSDGKTKEAFWMGNRHDTPSVPEKLEEFGNEGWELVNVTSINKVGFTQAMSYYFERPIE